MTQEEYIQELEDKLAGLKKENYALSAGQCVHPDALGVEEGRDNVFCRKNDEIIDLQDKLYIESRRADEVQYLMDAKVKELEEIIRNTDRAVLIAERKVYGDSSDRMDASQEAAHYNWLDDQNKKLEQQVAMLKDAIEDFFDFRGDFDDGNDSVFDKFLEALAKLERGEW